MMEVDINASISEGSAKPAVLCTRKGLDPHCIQLNTKIAVYRATVLTAVLYGAESWASYRQHIQMPTYSDAGCLPHVGSRVPYGYQMTAQDRVQQSTETCQNLWYRRNANEGIVEIGWPHSAN